MKKHAFKWRGLSVLLAFWFSRTFKIPTQGKKSLPFNLKNPLLLKIGRLKPWLTKNSFQWRKNMHSSVEVTIFENFYTFSDK